MVWPVLNFADAPGAIRFLTNAFGFEAGLVVPREGDDSVIEHAELRWPAGGGVILASAGKDSSAFASRITGNDCVYVVCDDPDTLFRRSVAAGAEVVLGLTDEDFGSRSFTVRDPEGNLWSFGTYSGS